MTRAELAALRTPSRPRLGAAGRVVSRPFRGRCPVFRRRGARRPRFRRPIDPPWAGVWRRRLALKSTAAVVQSLLNRREDEAALRDAVALARAGQDLGPAARMYDAFRTLCGPGDRFRLEGLAAVAADLQSPLDPEKVAALAAAAAAEAVTALRADAEALAIFCADAPLARSLGWPTPLPLLASELFARRSTGEGRRPRPGEAGWGKFVALSYARAPLDALDLAQDLSCRAARLTDAAPNCAPRGRRAPSRRCSPTTRSQPRPPSRVSATARAGGCSSASSRLARPASSPDAQSSASTGSEIMPRKSSPEPDFDRQLADLPPNLRWRGWKARVEAVLFAAAKPVTREVLARVVGRDSALELLLDDLKEDLRGRPIELVRAGESFALYTRPAFGPAVRVAFDIPADAKQLTKLEAGVLTAVALFQPVTRGEMSEMFGREISRDLIAAFRRG